MNARGREEAIRMVANVLTDWGSRVAVVDRPRLASYIVDALGVSVLDRLTVPELQAVLACAVDNWDAQATQHLSMSALRQAVGRPKT